jgi:alkylation response protein AidB-like acyl-CoA dehydrogenase
VNLELDTDQRDFLAVTTDLCETLTDEWRSVRPKDHGRSLKALADIGILGVRHPEPDGIGLGPVEAVLAAQSCGAALAPTALLVWADLLGPAVAGVITGEVSVTGAFHPASGFSHGGHTTMFVTVDADGAYLVESAAVEWEPVPNVDPTTPNAVVRGGIPTAHAAVADREMVQRWRRHFHVLVAAHLVGIGAGAVAASVAHAKSRHQFGRPIGSFQAVKHLLADAYTAVEFARSQVLTAALCWAEGHPSTEDQATAAAVVATRAATRAAETAIQVHGGMGFTAEAVPHLYYKRALALQKELRGADMAAKHLLDHDITLQGKTAP